MKVENIEVVEWSPSQKCFHVESVQKMLECNMRVFHGRSKTDYLPIGIFDHERDLQAFLDKAIKIKDKES